MSGPRRTVGWLPWIAMAVVVVGGLAFGTLGQGEPTVDDRVRNLSETIRCPSCQGQSVASSDTPSSEAVRSVIREQIELGRSDEEIRDYIDAQNPDANLLLDPPASGFSALVWALPVVVVVVAVAGLTYRFRDWRPGERRSTDADRELVAQALAEREER